MSSGDGTVPFANEPMNGMVIESYSKLGFKINHESFPKSIWVKFEQLPLTRLTLINGVIQDEITFVENVVRHEMQLIRTLDTEYMDLLYAEKKLAEKKNDFIPITEAVIGDWYIGAQCKDGLEMVYLGAFFQKSIHSYNDYSVRERDGKYIYTFHLQKDAPKRAFFAVREGELWDVVSFPLTNKKVKNLIQLYKNQPEFQEKSVNKEVILVSHNHYGPYKEYNGKSHRLDEKRIALNGEYPLPKISAQFKQRTGWSGDANYLAETKKNIEVDAFNFINENFRCTLSIQYAGSKGYNPKPSMDVIDFGDGQLTPRELLKKKMMDALPNLIATKEAYYIVDDLAKIATGGYSSGTYYLAKDIEEGKKTYEEIINEMIKNKN